LDHETRERARKARKAFATFTVTPDTGLLEREIGVAEVVPLLSAGEEADPDQLFDDGPVAYRWGSGRKQEDCQGR